MSIIPVVGLFEAHLTVSNLARSIVFYRDVLGLARRERQRHAAFFWIGEPGKSMLGLWSIHSSPMKLQGHVAFNVTIGHLVGAIGLLNAAGIAPCHGNGREPIVEPIVISWMPAASVFPPGIDWGWILLSEWHRRTSQL